MMKYFESGHESIDVLSASLSKVYGREVLEPKITLAGLTAKQRRIVLHIAQSYIDNPASTITSFKALQDSRGFSKFFKNREYEHGKPKESDVRNFDSLFRSDEFKKLKELYHSYSDTVIEMADMLIDSGLSFNQQRDILKNYLQIIGETGKGVEPSINIIEYLNNIL